MQNWGKYGFQLEPVQFFTPNTWMMAWNYRNEKSYNQDSELDDVTSLLQCTGSSCPWDFGVLVKLFQHFEEE
jgi:hypothetical protein